MNNFNRGEVWLADLNPGFRSKPGKIRPVLIIQNQAIISRGYYSTIVMPLTTQINPDKEKFRFSVKSRDRLIKDSDVMLDQIAAIDSAMFGYGPLTKLTEKEMGEVLKKFVRLIS